MPRDTGIAKRLRAYGLKVYEVSGWTTRGSTTFNPRGSVDHHTAGPRRGNAPSLGICINGRPDLPGPLCHVLVGRDLTCYVIAAGRANHAGAGGWKGLTGNASVYGVERENVGTAAEPWTTAQTKHAAMVHKALLDGRSSSMVARHAEWAPRRKVDTHSLSGNLFRTMVAAAMPPEPPKPPTHIEDDDMAIAVKGNASGIVYATNWIHKNKIDSQSELAQMYLTGLKNNNGKPYVVDQPTIDKIPNV